MHDQKKRGGSNEKLNGGALIEVTGKKINRLG